MPKTVAALSIAQVAGMAAGNTQARCPPSPAALARHIRHGHGTGQATRSRSPSDQLGPTGEELDILPGRSLDRVDGSRSTAFHAARHRRAKWTAGRPQSARRPARSRRPREPTEATMDRRHKSPPNVKWRPHRQLPGRSAESGRNATLLAAPVRPAIRSPPPAVSHQMTKIRFIRSSVRYPLRGEPNTGWRLARPFLPLARETTRLPGHGVHRRRGAADYRDGRSWCRWRQR